MSHEIDDEAVMMMELGERLKQAKEYDWNKNTHWIKWLFIKASTWRKEALDHKRELEYQKSLMEEM